MFLFLIFSTIWVAVHIIVVIIRRARKARGRLPRTQSIQIGLKPMRKATVLLPCTVG